MNILPRGNKAQYAREGKLYEERIAREKPKISITSVLFTVVILSGIPWLPVVIFHPIWFLNLLVAITVFFMGSFGTIALLAILQSKSRIDWNW
jgi:hypothetical protein